MKLCIFKPDGSNAEIILSNNQPSLNNINKEILFLENSLYEISIRSEEIFENIELFIGDYSIPLKFNKDIGCYETVKDTIFNGCFDLACISVNIDNGYGDEKVYYSEYLRIATTKQTAKQVEQMLYEIENNIPNFLEICFSRNMKKSGLAKNEIRSIWNTLKIVDEIIDVYESNYGYFRNHKKSVIKQEAAILDVKSMRKINQDSLIWIANNPDNLIETDNESPIKYKGKYYAPTKIKTYVSKYSYDIYENKMVIGFLKTIIDYINNQIVGFNREILELENIPNSIIIQLPNTHELTGRCVYVYYKGVLERFEEKRDILQKLYYMYIRILECKSEGVVGLPKLTNTFKRVYHYRICYECMIKWFKMGDYTFNHLNYLFKLKTLSRIFEYYCLIKLQIAVLQNGYILKEVNKITYDIEDDIEDINNKYVFSGHGQEITLFYEPTIWANHVNEEINLYSTGYNFIKSKWNNKWSPDFVLKIVTTTNEYYYIIDAKYSKARNVNRIYLPQLVLKYSSQIASKDKFFSDIIGVGAIYPDDSDNIEYFKRNKIGSNKQSLPNYFSLSVVGGEEGNIILRDRIANLLAVIDEIESEETPIIDRDKEEVITVINLSENQKENIENNLEKVPLENNVIDNTNNSKEVKLSNVYGKRCFYYAKGMCLRQKTRCKIEGDICELYEYKNSKELLKDENSCRNFIQYFKKGKINRVECAIFGISGCVGTDSCKFYLKKKQK